MSNKFNIQVDEFTITDPSHGIGPDAPRFYTPEESIKYYGTYHEQQIRKWYEQHEDKLIIDWSVENEDDPPGWDDIVNEIKDRCKLNSAAVIAMKIVSDFGYVRQDAHVPKLSVRYQLTIDLYEDLDEICQCEDCKNGVQLYQEADGTYYFQITGANFYDKKDNYAGTDTVKVWFKVFNWETL